jgi:hypothetical protein
MTSCCCTSQNTRLQCWAQHVGRFLSCLCVRPPPYPQPSGDVTVPPAVSRCLCIERKQRALLLPPQLHKPILFHSLSLFLFHSLPRSLSLVPDLFKICFCQDEGAQGNRGSGHFKATVGENRKERTCERLEGSRGGSE